MEYLTREGGDIRDRDGLSTFIRGRKESLGFLTRGVESIVSGSLGFDILKLDGWDDTFLPSITSQYQWVWIKIVGHSLIKSHVCICNWIEQNNSNIDIIVFGNQSWRVHSIRI